MPKYLEVAAEANVVAKNLMKLVREVIGNPLPEEVEGRIAEMVARLVNLGIRCSPRGVQHTIRLNAVRRAVQDLPVKVSMEERKDDCTGRVYNALVIQPKGGEKSIEIPSNEE